MWNRYSAAAKKLLKTYTNDFGLLEVDLERKSFCLFRLFLLQLPCPLVFQLQTYDLTVFLSNNENNSKRR